MMAHDADMHCQIYADLPELIDTAPSSGIVLVHDSEPVTLIPKIVAQMSRAGWWCPIVGYCEDPGVDKIVEAMRSGALWYIRTPKEHSQFSRIRDEIAEHAEFQRELHERTAKAHKGLLRLTDRERQVLEGVVAGESSKSIARELDISPRTVEIHRAKMLGKIGARNAADAVRLMVEASAFATRAA